VAFDAQRCASAPRRRTVAHKAQREAVEGLVAGDEVVADGVDDQPQELVLLRAGPKRARPRRPARAYGAMSGAGPGAPRSAGSRRPCSPPASPHTCACRARVTCRRGCRPRKRGALGGGDQVGRLLVPELDLIAQHVDVEQLPHILLLIVLCGTAASAPADAAAAGGRGAGARPSRCFQTQTSCGSCPAPCPRGPSPAPCWRSCGCPQ